MPIFGEHQRPLPGTAAQFTTTLWSAVKSATERLGMNEKTARVALSRLRRKYAAVIREAVAETVDLDGAVQAELRYLMDNFS